MKPITILVLFLTFRGIAASSCVETFERRENHYMYYYRYNEFREKLIESSTLTCFNLSSLENLPLPSMYKHVPHEYEQYLNITKSRIPTIPKDAFLMFHSITKLYLSGIYINDIEKGAFNNLTKLKELYLNDNELRMLPDELFSTLDQLEVLDLSGNRLHLLNSKTFAGLKNTKELTLKDNDIWRIGENVFRDMENIRVLDLSDNIILKIFDHDLPLSENLTLVELDLSNTYQRTFDLDLSNTSLKYLKVPRSVLVTFDFALLPQTIEEVTLSNNGIKTVTNLEKLFVPRLRLDNNLIQDLNQSFSHASELYLSHNNINVLENSLFNKSETLTIIDLSHNSISSVDKDVFLSLTRLEKLNLSYNSISEITSGTFKNLSSLEYLDLSHNNITEFQFGIFETLTRLILLDVSSNQLVQLDQHVLFPLSSLSDLRFDNNQVTSIDVEALTVHCKDLTKVSLNNNPWTCKNLVNIYHKFKLHNIDVAVGHSFDDENFHGIPCVNKEEVDEPEIKNSSFSIESFYRDFQKAVNKGVLDSKINRFFNEDFQNSSFYRYFYNENISSKLLNRHNEVATKNDSGMLIAVNVIQMILSLFVLAVILLIIVALKRHRSEFSSRTELYYKHRK